MLRTVVICAAGAAAFSPAAAPPPAACSANTDCAERKLKGDCCPTTDGVMLGCCGGPGPTPTPIPTPTPTPTLKPTPTPTPKPPTPSPPSPPGQCSAATTCLECSGNSTSCGWCDGVATDENGNVLTHQCLSLSNTSNWHCLGTLLNEGSCGCKGASVSADLAATWRGFSIDEKFKGEVSFELSNVAKPDGSLQGRAKIVADGVLYTANVTTFAAIKGGDQCPTAQLLFDLDNATSKGSTIWSCAYKADWAAGGDAHVISLACNFNASMPKVAKDKTLAVAERNMELYKCTDPTHCDFAPAPLAPPPAPPATAADKEKLDAFVRDVLGVNVGGDPCAGHSSCKDCSAGAGCTWCMGDLSLNGTTQPGKGHCYGPDKGYTCSGLALHNGNCQVYKCNWFEYYVTQPADCKALNKSCSTITDADDPDFQRLDTPAQPYQTQDQCYEGCQDPTIGCNGTQCVRTHKCDPASNCTSCSLAQPTVMQGLQISNKYEPGLWTFNFSAAGGVYTNVTITSPDPTGKGSAHYDIMHYRPANKSTNTPAQAQLYQFGLIKHAAIFDIRQHAAFGENVYMAIGPPDLTNFGEVMYNGGQEYALMACSYDQGLPVTGDGQPLVCDIGHIPNAP